MTSKFGRYAAVIFICASFTGCAVFEEVPEEDLAFEQSNAASPLGNAELYTNLLANELFANLVPSGQFRFAVTTFVPVDSLQYNGNKQHPLMLLGHQLEQGMITEAARRGFITQDFKTTNDIIIEEESDRVFSRNIEHLNAYQQVDFFITGTITEQQEGAMVNARIINARSKDVIAAATRFFPAELFWEREKVTVRNGMIYRTGSE